MRSILISLTLAISFPTIGGREKKTAIDRRSRPSQAPYEPRGTGPEVVVAPKSFANALSFAIQVDVLVVEVAIHLGRAESMFLPLQTVSTTLAAR